METDEDIIKYLQEKVEVLRNKRAKEVREWRFKKMQIDTDEYTEEELENLRSKYIHAKTLVELQRSRNKLNYYKKKVEKAKENKLVRHHSKKKKKEE